MVTMVSTHREELARRQDRKLAKKKEHSSPDRSLSAGKKISIIIFIFSHQV